MPILRAGSSGRIRRFSNGVKQLASRLVFDRRDHMGVNTSHVTYFASFAAFIDLMKQASDWVNNTPFDGSAVIQTDPSGYVSSLEAGQSVISYVYNHGSNGFSSFNTPGNYMIVRYSGEGSGLGTAWRLNMTGTGGAVSAISHDTVAKRIVYSLTNSVSSNNYLQLIINTVVSSNYLRNIQIIPEVYEEAYLAGQRFNPVYLEEKAPFKGVRMMNFTHINADLQLTTWADRRTDTYRNYSGPTEAWENAVRDAKDTGMVPYEEQIALCNELECDIWVNIPHSASLDWSTSLATLLRDTLNPNLKIYVERSNECWNPIFVQYHDDFDSGQIMYSGTVANIYYRGYYYSAHAARLIMDEFRSIFASEPTRLVTVFAWQKGTDGISEDLMEWENLEGSIDAWAIAPYMAGQNGGVASKLGTNPQATVSAVYPHTKITVDMTVDEVLDSVELDLTTDLVEHESLAAICAAHGLDLIFYEGGQHLAGVGSLQNNTTLTDLFISANRHERMREIYAAYWEWGRSLTLNAGLMCLYADVYYPDKYGSWGILESQGQVKSTAPKWLGTMDFIDRYR